MPCAKNQTTFILLLMLACLPTPSHAGDGRFELNHEAALKGIPAIGDSAPGYPITISQQGSYILTGDLEQSDPNVDVLEITADDVSIDLNGFAIRGSTTCTAVNHPSGWLSHLDCSPTGAGTAITAIGQTRISIHDGSIHGIAGNGVELTDGSVHNVRFGEVGNVCLGALGVASVRNVKAELCDYTGIDIYSGSVELSQVMSAGGNGIEVSSNDSLILHSVAERCAYYGISIANRNSVLHSVASSNGSDGINAGDGNSIVGCSIQNNNRHGLYSTSFGTNAYSGNAIMSNSIGTIGGTATWVEIGPNLCNGNTTCP
jgi:hypothetical protein